MRENCFPECFFLVTSDSCKSDIINLAASSSTVYKKRSRKDIAVWNFLITTAAECSANRFLIKLVKISGKY